MGDRIQPSLAGGFEVGSSVEMETKKNLSLDEIILKIEEGRVYKA